MVKKVPPMWSSNLVVHWILDQNVRSEGCMDMVHGASCDRLSLVSGGVFKDKKTVFCFVFFPLS